MNESFARRANLFIHNSVGTQNIRLPNGDTRPIIGTVDVPLYMQLLLDTDGEMVAWDRFFMLKGVSVAALSDASPKDLYVAWKDWAFKPGQPMPATPLGSLAYMVMSGATVVDSPRVPKDIEASKIVFQGTPIPLTAALSPVEDISLLSTEELRQKIRAQFAPEFIGTTIGNALEEGLLERRKIFGQVNPAECTEVIEFTVVGDPVPVSFKVPISRRVPLDEIEAGLQDWINRGLVERVPWSEKAYGFVIVVPKAGGKWRITINPSGVNPATKRMEPEGGFMPDSIVKEAQRAGRMDIACQIDLAEAFTTISLGPNASKLSTFTSPIGKLRWKQGYFGWHSFPAVFQRVIMERVVLPTMDEELRAVILAWIDDIVIAGKDQWSMLRALLGVLDRILAIGGRLALHKCFFFLHVINWCGVEVDLIRNKWRIDPARTASLTSTPEPRNRDALRHVLGILRHYFWGVEDQMAQRKRISLLAELDYDRVDISSAWTVAHSDAFKTALCAIANGKWMLVYDPRKPVWVTTDASSELGFAVTAHQFEDDSGIMTPISFFSKGWIGPQLNESDQLRGWTPQVKEMYAMMYATTKVMPDAFPYAEVILLCDNKNLSSLADSADKRIVRWQQEVRDSGAIRRRWVPGHYNTIADYGSRTVVPDLESTLTEEEKFEMHIYSMVSTTEPTLLGEGEGLADKPESSTVVPGHLHAAPLTAKIAAAQAAASDDEKRTWSSKPKYSQVTLAGHTLHLLGGLLIVPINASEIKRVLFQIAHDNDCHYAGSGRTVQNLKIQAKVVWIGMDDEVKAYIGSCFKCQFAKSGLATNKGVGTLSPTIPPAIHHTWYVDFKGPMPEDTGYLLAVVEGLSKVVKLRYVPTTQLKDLTEELEEVITVFGTAPVILRSDGGPPFNSAGYSSWCAEWGITPVLGAPDHSAGQGTVENKFKGIAHAIIATLGGKAPTGWYKDPHMLDKLERVIGSTFTSVLGGSPYWALTGREPRTRLSAATQFSGDALESPGVTENDVCEIVAAHHAQLNAVQGRVTLATSLAQALTKNKFDRSRSPGDYKVGEWVLVHFTAPNRMLPHFRGPYQVIRVSDDFNFVTTKHFLTPDGAAFGPYHVSRLLRFDFSRATAREIAEHQLDEDSAIVNGVKGHRLTAEGGLELLIEWVGDPIQSWMAAYGLRRVTKVIEYCTSNGLPSPGSGARRTASIPSPTGTSRGRGRGRGRGR